MASTTPFQRHGGIAIVGGGIAGLTLAISLLERNFKVTVYEQARHFGEIGAGVAFHPAAQRAMAKCSPVVLEAFHKVATFNQNPDKRQVFFDMVDGRIDRESGAASTDQLPILWTMTNESGINGVHRAHFLNELIQHIPEGIAHFAKHLDDIEGPNADGAYILKFHDGTTATHDAVIGTDGIKSTVRGWLLGSQDHPSASPSYTHMYAYRGLIPMDRAVRELGADAAGNAKIYLGPDGHVLTFAVSHGEIMNVVAFKKDPGDWPDHKHLTRHSEKSHVYEDFKHFGGVVKHIIDQLEPELDCWAIFDTGDHPLQRYNRGKVLVLGDAGHATTPHHGSGAGMCIEDAAVLTAMLTDENVLAEAAKGAEAETRVLQNVFEAYSAERIGRTQRLVQSSRRAGELVQGRTELGRDLIAVAKELHWRYSYFWNGDLEEYIRNAKWQLKDIMAMDQ